MKGYMVDKRKQRIKVRNNRRVKPYVYAYELAEAAILLNISQEKLKEMIAEKMKDDAEG